MTQQTFPTWKHAMDIAKELQNEYQLPIFAMTFKGMCSCCASPEDFHKEAYLTPDVAKKDWKDIDSYVFFKNSFNGAGEAKFYSMVPVNWEGKRKKEWNQFGTLNNGGYFDGRDYQHVAYELSESFTMKDLCEMLTRFVNALNEVSDTKYELKLPENKSQCATIARIKSSNQ